MLENADLRGSYLARVDWGGTHLTRVNWQEVSELTVIAVQIDIPHQNGQISYIKDLNIWTTGCFQGDLGELVIYIEKTHFEDGKLRHKYYRVISFILTEIKICGGAA